MSRKTKVCKSCKRRRPLTNFHAHVATRDRLIAKCKKCYNAYQREYRARSHREGISAKCWLRYKESNHGRLMLLFGAARRRAKKAGLSFTLTMDWLEKKFEPMKCEMTGLPFTLIYGTKYRVNPLSPSLDRIDNKRGYTKKNTRLVCSWFNLAKNQFTDAQLMLCANALVAHQSKQ